MKTILLLISFCFTSLVTFAQTEVLTNQSVLEMIELGFSEDVILTKIKTSEVDFDTSIAALKVLKEKGVSDAIMMAIMNGTSDNRSEDIEEIEAGIYFANGDQLIRMLPTVFSGTKTNTLGSAFSYGIASSDIKSILNNAESNNVIKTDSPEFWFYFDSRNNVDFNNWWFFSATSPNEFVLVRLDKKKKRRELKTGSVNVYAGTNIGVAEKHLIPFNIETIDNNTFKVVPKEPFEDGEYCFFYQGTIPQGGYVNQSVFDFSIQSGKRVESKKESHGLLGDRKYKKKKALTDDVYE